jgi:hypothetical protein
MSESGVPVEEIARLAGHTNSRTTELVYRHQLRPVMEKEPRPSTSSSDAMPDQTDKATPHSALIYQQPERAASASDSRDGSRGR